jgi:hypothetical protein
MFGMSPAARHHKAAAAFFLYFVDQQIAQGIEPYARFRRDADNIRFPDAQIMPFVNLRRHISNRYRFDIGKHKRLIPLVQQKNQIRRFLKGHCPTDALALNDIFRFPNASRVIESNQISTEIKVAMHDISSGTSNLRHDRHFSFS